MSPVLSLRGLNVGLRGPDGVIPVVQDVDLDLYPGTITGLAGESGSGKTLTALAMLGLNDSSVFRQSVNSLTVNQRSVLTAEGRVSASVRGRELAMIFQDPSTSLDPVMRIGHQIELAIARHGDERRKPNRTRSTNALKSVGFGDPEAVWKCYPHELSGGMRQLAVIAMAQAVRPRVLIADEPTTALDMSTQALILDRLSRLAEERGTAILFITHDLRLLARHAASVLVMYHGRIVEATRGETLFNGPQHPYTRALAEALPRMDRPYGTLPETIPGQVPLPGQAVSGCAFAPRCLRSDSRCVRDRPELRRIDDLQVACHYPQRSAS